MLTATKRWSRWLLRESIDSTWYKVGKTTSERVLKKDFLKSENLNRTLDDENSSEQPSKRKVASEDK